MASEQQERCLFLSPPRFSHAAQNYIFHILRDNTLFCSCMFEDLQAARDFCSLICIVLRCHSVLVQEETLQSFTLWHNPPTRSVASPQNAASQQYLGVPASCSSRPPLLGLPLSPWAAIRSCEKFFLCTLCTLCSSFSSWSRPSPKLSSFTRTKKSLSWRTNALLTAHLFSATR